MTNSDQQSGAVDVEQMDKYHTSPLRFPLHVLDQEGEPLCGTMADDQYDFVERYGLDELATLRERKGDERLSFLLGDLCGNCRRSLFSEDGTGELVEVWEERQRHIESTKA